MTNNFERAFDKVLLLEGGYGNNEYDSGGETKYGITKKTARANGYKGLMRELNVNDAKKIMYEKYWLKCNLDNVAKIHTHLAERIFDFAINAGNWQSVKLFQTVLNALNKRQTLWKDIKEDGLLGNNTIKSLRECFKYERRALACINGYEYEKGSFYIRLNLKNDKIEEFMLGLLTNRVKVIKKL